MSTVIRISPPTFYEEQYELEKPWLATAGVTCVVTLALLISVVAAYVIGDNSMKSRIFLLSVFLAGALYAGFTAYRNWTGSRTIAVDSDGLHYRFTRDKWRHIPVGDIRSWSINRRKFFWLNNGNYYLQELIVEVNNSAAGWRGRPGNDRLRIKTRRALEAGQAIDRAKIFTNTLLEPAPRHAGTTVMDLESALARFTTVINEKART